MTRANLYGCAIVWRGYFAALTAFICLGVSSASYAQNSIQNINDNAYKFELFYRAYPLINPASMGSNEKVELYGGYKNQIGLFNGVRTFYTHANITLNKKSSLARQVVGLTFIGDKEGDFFSKNRLCVLYAIHLKLSSKYTLSAAANGALLSYGFQSTTASPGGSDNKFSVSTGLFFYSTDFHAGIAVDDMNSPYLIPVSQRFYVKKYLALTLDKTFVLNGDFNLFTAGLFNLFSGNEISYNISSLIQYHRLISVGLFYRYHSGLGAALGMDNIPIAGGSLKVLLAYKIPSANLTRLDLNTFEVNVFFALPGKK